MKCRAETILILRAMDNAAEKVILALRMCGEVAPTEDRLGSVRSLAQLQRLLFKLKDKHVMFRDDCEGDHKGYNAFHKALRAFNTMRLKKKTANTNGKPPSAAHGEAENGVNGSAASAVASGVTSAVASGVASSVDSGVTSDVASAGASVVASESNGVSPCDDEDGGASITNSR